MRLWLLWRLNEERDDGYQGFVVRARSEAAARRLADRFRSRSNRGVWIDKTSAACEELPVDGAAKVVLAAGDLAPETSQL
jgi:hypothetical protein